MKIVELIGTTDALGDVTITADNKSIGYVEKIVMDYDDGATGADLTFTNEDGTVTTSVLTITNAGTSDVTWLPRSLANKSTDGSAFTDVAEKIFVTGQMKVVVAQGGNAKNFRFIVTLTDE